MRLARQFLKPSEQLPVIRFSFRACFYQQNLSIVYLKTLFSLPLNKGAFGVFI